MHRHQVRPVALYLVQCIPNVQRNQAVVFRVAEAVYVPAVRVHQPENDRKNHVAQLAPNSKKSKSVNKV